MLVMTIGEARSPLDPGVVFRVGDLVTRGFGDRHRVVEAADDMIVTECIAVGTADWMLVGERDHNLCRRFEHAHDVEGTHRAPK